MSHQQHTNRTAEHPSDQGPLPRGTPIGRNYVIEELIGAGGVGDVYIGVQRPFNQPVAIKVSRKQSGADSTRVTRFINEARATAQLNHPGIVNIYDYGEHAPGVPYLVMEALEGCTLEAWLYENPTPSLVWVKRIVGELLEALSVAHKQGIVHRDLKPTNIFMVDLETQYERPILLDFGLAFINQPGSDVRLTNRGELNGTPQFLPPEYILSQEISPAFDVYQVGLIMAEALSGFPAIVEENTYECLMRHCDGDLDIAPEVFDGPFGPVIERALSRDPRARYQDAAELLEAIMAVELPVFGGHRSTPANSNAQRAQTDPVPSAPTLDAAPAPLLPVEPVSTPAHHSAPTHLRFSDEVESVTPEPPSNETQASLTRILRYPFDSPKRRQYIIIAGLVALGALVLGLAFTSEETSASRGSGGETAVHRAAPPVAPDSISTYHKEAIGGSIFDAMSLADDVALKARALAETPQEAPSK